MVFNETHAEAIAATSAAYAWNFMAEIAKLPPSEGFNRLYKLFHTALVVYADCKNGWGRGPEPSKN